MTQNTLPKDGKGTFMPNRTATKPNQARTATFDLIRDQTTHANNVGFNSSRFAEIIAGKATKEKFIAKNPYEYKITVIGYATGKIIKDATSELTLTQKFALNAKIKDLIENANFCWSLKLEDGKAIFWKLRRDVPENVNRKNSKRKYVRRCRRWSIVVLVDMPGLADFYQKLQNLLNEATDKNLILDLPIPQVTLFVKGRSLDGIGLESEAMFNQYKVKRF